MLYTDRVLRILIIYEARSRYLQTTAAGFPVAHSVNVYIDLLQAVWDLYHASICVFFPEDANWRYHNNYHQKLLLKHKSNVKKAWKIIKMVIDKRKRRQISNRFKCNGKNIENENLIANKLNDFFINIGPELAKNIPPGNKSPSGFITNVSEATFTINAVTDTEVANIIGNFNDSSAGWDGLRPKIIKGIKDYVKLPLTHICNLSFVSGVFPTELEVANLVPIYKSNDEMIFSNYRPVSVLPVLSKLLERLMYNRRIHYINENRLLYKSQFGFQKGKSTEMALIVLIYHLSEALDKGEYVIGVFSGLFKSLRHCWPFNFAYEIK